MSSGQAWAPTAVDGETTTPGKDDAEPSASRVGEVLDRYAVLEQVGKGGMGVVYRAYDPKLQREVALKLVMRQDPGARARIVREARTMAQLRHPNVVSVYDVVETDAGPVLVMPLLEGGNLRQLLRANSKPWREIIDLWVRAGRGLEAAHGAGLIHRDFKPDNVLLSERGEVLVTDFGLAQSSGGKRDSHVKTSGPGASRPGIVMGTNYYMAPEQHMGDPDNIGAATDQYAFCASLWEALNGDPPFIADSSRAYYDAKKAGPPPWKAADVPKRIVRAIERGLSFEPKKRWPDMGTLLGELDRAPRARLWVLGSVAALGVIAAVWAVATSNTQPATVCPDPQQALEETWSPAVEAKYRAAILETGLPYAQATADTGATRLNEYGEAWREAFSTSCRATREEGTQSEELLDRSMACLGQARMAMGHVVSELSLGDPKTLLRQDRVIDTLVKPERCNDKVRLMADEIYSPEASEGYEQVLARAGAVRAKQAARQYGAADEAAAELVRLVDENAEPDVRWVVLNLRGTTLVDTRQFAAARVVLREALTLAEALDDDRKVLSTTLSLAWLSVRSEPGDEDVLTMLASAEGVAKRIGEPDAWEDYAHAAIRAHDELGNYQEARRLSEEVLRRAEQDNGPDSLVVASAQYRVAANIQDPTRSLALLNHVEEVYVEHYGPKHPSVGWVQNDQATYYAWLGDQSRALERQQKALQTWREAYPEGHYTIGAALSNMSSTYKVLGQLDRAAEMSTQALEHFAELDLEDSRYAAMAHNNRANAYVQAEKPVQAKADFERALEIRTELYPEDHPAPAKAKIRLGGLLVGFDDPQERERGMGLVREGWTTIDRIDAELMIRHEATLELAIALWATQPHEDVRSEVIDLLQTAMELAGAIGDTDRKARIVQFYSDELAEP